MPTAIRTLTATAKVALLRDLTQRIRRQTGRHDATALDVKDAGGYGVVLWSRPEDEDAFVVHHWALVDTAGNDRPFMLYDGGYFETLDEAKEDFEATRPR